MLTRCNNPNFAQYADYGGRGVTVCKRWDPAKGGSFANFLEDMGVRPEGSTLDKDLKPGCSVYSKDTCQWIDAKRQNRNRRTSMYFTINGVTKCLKDWVEQDTELPYTRVYARLRRGWSIEKALELI